MGKLDRFVTKTQLDMDAVLAEIEAEEADGNGHIQPGDICHHVDLLDFFCKVVAVDGGKCKVEVLDGWRGQRPLGPVTVPREKLEAV